jgi:hypothetical protein
MAGIMPKTAVRNAVANRVKVTGMHTKVMTAAVVLPLAIFCFVSSADQNPAISSNDIPQLIATYTYLLRQHGIDFLGRDPKRANWKDVDQLQESLSLPKNTEVQTAFGFVDEQFIIPSGQEGFSISLDEMRHQNGKDKSFSLITTPIRNAGNLVAVVLSMKGPERVFLLSVDRALKVHLIYDSLNEDQNTSIAAGVPIRPIGSITVKQNGALVLSETSFSSGSKPRKFSFNLTNSAVLKEVR